MQDIEKKLYTIIEELMKSKDVELSSTVCLIDDLNFDSIQLMNLIVTIEEQFGIEFNDSDMLFDNFNNLLDLCNLIEVLLREKEG